MVNFLFVWNLLQWRPDCELLSIYTLFLLLNPLSLFFLHYHFVYFINSAVQFYSKKKKNCTHVGLANNVVVATRCKKATLAIQ